jgi:hypothetical protein
LPLETVLSAADPLQMVDGDHAVLLYDCERPQPVRTLKLASFFRVAKGKIRTYETLFDATELRKLQGPQRED